MKEEYESIVVEAKAFCILMSLVKVLEIAVQEKDYETLDFIAIELQNIILELIARKVRNDGME